MLPNLSPIYRSYWKSKTDHTVKQVKNRLMEIQNRPYGETSQE